MPAWRQVLDRFRPDVVHLNNIYFHLSPSILRPLAKRKPHPHGHDAARLQAGLPHLPLPGRRRGLRGVSRRRSSPTPSANAATEVRWPAARWWPPKPRSISAPTPTGPSAPSSAPVSSWRARWPKPASTPTGCGPFGHFAEDRDDRTGHRTRLGDGDRGAGRLASEKGIVTSCSTPWRTSKSDITLTVAGDGPERAELEAHVQRVAPGRVDLHRSPRQGRIALERYPTVGRGRRRPPRGGTRTNR